MYYPKSEYDKRILADARYQDVGALPSQFHPYSWKRILARPFERAELSLLSKAVLLQDDDYVIRALDLTISEDAYSLTTFDFYYMLAWQLYASFPTTPYNATWICENAIPINKYTGERATSDTLQENISYERCGCDNIAVVPRATLSIAELPDELEPIPAPFDYPRVASLKLISGLQLSPEYSLLAETYSWLRGVTQAEKEQVFDDYGLSVIRDVRPIIDKYSHGVKRSITLKCRKCGVAHEHTLDFSASSFFQ